MRILVISDNYPSKKHPTNGVFVYNLIQQFAKVGHKVTVIAPFQLVPRKIKFKSQDYGNELCDVYYPLYFSASTKKIGKFNTYTIARKQQINSIRQITKKLNQKFDLIYCHFIKNALLAVEAFPDSKIPIIAAVGENKNIEVVQRWYGKDQYFKLFNKISGFVAVSEVVKQKLLKMNIEESQLIVAPNGVDFDVFFPQKDAKQELRLKYNLPLDKILGIFVGHFIENKGPLRVVKASQSISNLGLIMVGEGKQNPESGNIYFKGKVVRSAVPELLNCADFFILPTHHEGSSNAIAEALACGLPVISSDIPEIKVQCTLDCSILVDPDNIRELSEAMKRLSENPELREQMSIAAVERSKTLGIVSRAEKILNFCETFVK